MHSLAAFYMCPDPTALMDRDARLPAELPAQGQMVRLEPVEASSPVPQGVNHSTDGDFQL